MKSDKFYDIEFIDYQNLPDPLVHKYIETIVEFDEPIKFSSYWIEIRSTYHNKKQRTFKIRIHNLEE